MTQIARGTRYLERGQPAQILISYGPGSGVPDLTRRYFHTAPKRWGPRNVMLLRLDGEVAVRPFRGLRKPKDGDA